MSDREPYTIRRLSNYEGFKRLDRLLEKISERKLKPPREPVRDYLCEVCSTRTRSITIVRSEISGHKLDGLKFVGKFVVCCDDCSRRLNRAGVPQAAAREDEALARLGLVRG